MSADENVTIGFGAEHAAALSAIQTVADYLEKMGEKGKKAGEGMGHSFQEYANKGIEEFASKITSSLGPMALFEPGIDTVSEALKALEERGKAAWEAISQKAGGERAWQDWANPGENIQDIGKQLEKIGTDTGMGTGARQAFSMMMKARPPGATANDLLADLAESGKGTFDPGDAANRAKQIFELRRDFPEFSREGAAAELGNRGWQSQSGGLEKVEALRRGTGGKDSFGFLSQFGAALGPHVDPATAMRVQKMINDNAGQFTQSGSTETNLDFLQNDPQAKSLLATITGITGDDGQQEMMIGGKKTGIRGIEAIEPLKELLLKRGDAQKRFLAAAGGTSNDTRKLSELRSHQQSIRDQKTQQLTESDRLFDQDFEGISADDPYGALQHGMNKVDEKLKDRGYGAWSPFHMRNDVARMVEGVRRSNLDDQDETGADISALKYGSKLLRGYAGKEEGQNAEAIEKMAAYLERIEAILERGQKLTIQDGGDHHRARATPVDRVGL